ncbi:protein kinase [Gordonia sp. TBRC 11910]|uniref:non-specific serine/threonine protein kinase n=1 Tax=Gordonia asplenii TaxID=2725283 RepID=A0A848KZ19_9ACTN|nr:protein kinase [Gordonia asplenii]NMO03974.1 protein kinase [Gordonia asplenii]
MSASRVGTQFGPYRLDQLLGRGGMGEVYRAYDTVKDREVALKLLNPQLADDQVYQERFRRESRAVARLGEPHIIPIHDFGDLDGVLYLDMRLVSGKDLRKVLSGCGALSPKRAVGIVGQIAEALDAAHAGGLVHRDVKPENILVTDHDFAYLVDFGIAQADSSTHLTQTGSTIGSFAYMAPEQFDNEAASPASDIYALTAVLFECLTGQVPHPAGTVSKAIKAAVLDPTPTLRSLNADLPEALEPVIARGLAKDPTQRYASAADFAADARAALGMPGEGATAAVKTISLRKGDDESAVAEPASAGPGAEGATEIMGAGAEPGAYDRTQFGVPAAYSPTMMRPSGPVPLGSGYAPPPQPGFTSQPQPGYISQPQPGYISQPQPGYVSQPQPVGPHVYGQPPGYPQQPQRRSMVPILAVVAVILLIVLGGVIYFALSSKSANTANGPTTVTQTVAPQTTTATSTTTPAVPAPASTPCDSTVGIGTDTPTSCPFAAAVRSAYLSSGVKGEARQVTAYSPVTGMSYVMACNPQGGVVVCTGGNNAVVVIY